MRHYLNTAMQIMQLTTLCNNCSERSALPFKLEHTVCFVLQLKLPRRDFLNLTSAHFLSLQLRKYEMVQNPLGTTDKTLFTEGQVTFASPGIPLTA
jgi:hypothetical protein